MSQQNQASFLLQAIGENYIMKTYAKGERKKKLPVVILSVALGMTMIPDSAHFSLEGCFPIIFIIVYSPFLYRQISRGSAVCPI